MKKRKVGTGDNMKRIIVIYAALSMAACNRISQQQPGQALPPATKSAIAAPMPPTKAKLDCKVKDSGSENCKVYVSVQRAFDDIQVFEATLTLDSTARKKHAKPMSVSDADGGRLATLDAATAEITDPSVKSLVSQLRAAYMDCESKIYSDNQVHPKGILDDAFDAGEIADSCAFGIQRQADSIGVALGVQVDPVPQDVFGMTWGMSMVDAISVNPKTTGREADQIFYQSTIDNQDTTVVLIFTNDKLARVFYSINAKHSNDQAYLTDFANIDDLLKDKYGNPISSGPQWVDDLYKDRQDEWGMAVAAGRMQMRSEWNTPRTDITHVMFGDNFKITHGIAYTSRELKTAMKQAARDKGKSQL